MKDFQSHYSGPQIDEAVARSFTIDMSLNGWVKVKCSESDPYNLDYLMSPGNYTIYYFEGGTSEMNAVSPIKVSVLYMDGILTQLVMILDLVQCRQYIDNEWTSWESWYSNGYIYQQPTPPEHPVKFALWIDNSVPARPTMFIWDTIQWREVRPTDAMDKSVYDSKGMGIDIFAYIDQKIKELNTTPDGESSFSDAYAIHVADKTIHLTPEEKVDLLSRPSREELENEVATVTAEAKADITKVANDTLSKIGLSIGMIESESDNMLDHFSDETIHVNSVQVSSWDAKEEKDHEHNLDGRVKISAADVIAGVFPMERLPQSIVELVCKVNTDADRFKLTTDDVQNGDSVYVRETKKFYYVIDETKLANEDGYLFYSMTLSAVIDWSQITDKPTTRDGYNLMDVYTMDEVDELLYSSDDATTDYLTKVFARAKQYYHLKHASDIRYSEDTRNAITYGYGVSRAMGYDGNVYLCVNKPDDTSNTYLSRFTPLQYTKNQTWDVNQKQADYIPEDNNMTEVIALPYLNSDSAVVKAINPVDTMREYYSNTTRTVDVEITDGASIADYDGTYTMIYSTVSKQMFSVNEEGVVTQITPNSEDIVVWDPTTRMIYTIDSDSESPSYFHRNIIAENMQFDGAICGYVADNGDYSESVVLHDRNEITIQPLSSNISESSLITLSTDVVIADTITVNHKIMALVLEAEDTPSLVNAAWKAFKFNLAVYEINPRTMTYEKHPVCLIDYVYEVGSSLEEDYNNYLNSFFANTQYAHAPMMKPFRMAYSNGAYIVYSTLYPMVSLNLVTWHMMHTQLIDTSLATVKEIKITGNMLRPTSCIGNDALMICTNTDSIQFAYSVDNYNFYVVEPKQFIGGYSTFSNDKYKMGITTSLCATKSGIYIVADDYLEGEGATKEEAFIANRITCFQYYASTTTNIIDKKIKDVEEIIKTEIGVPSSKVEYYEFSQFLNNPVDITNGEGGYFALFVDSTLQNPTYWHRIHYIEGCSVESIPPISNLTPDETEYYIKGGIMINDVQYLFLFLVNDQRAVKIGLASVKDDEIVILAKGPLSSAFTVEFAKNIEYKFFMVNNEVYGYPEYHSTVMDIVKDNFPVIYFNNTVFEMTFISFVHGGAYHKEVAIPTNQWVGIVNNRVVMLRYNRTYRKNGELAFEVSCSDVEDFKLTNGFTESAIYYANTIDPSLEEGTDFEYPYGFDTFLNPIVLEKSICLPYSAINANGEVEIRMIEYTPNISIKLSSTPTANIGLYDGRAKPYAFYYDKLSCALIAVMASDEGTHKIILFYKDLEASSDGPAVKLGEITNDTLSEMAYHNTWKVNDMMSFYVNHTLVLMGTHPDHTEADLRLGTFGGTPLIEFVRDNGAEMYKKCFILTAKYMEKINEYDEKFTAMQKKILRAKDYTDEILRIIG